jgi:hypothetical protein
MTATILPRTTVTETLSTDDKFVVVSITVNVNVHKLFTLRVYGSRVNVSNCFDVDSTVIS